MKRRICSYDRVEVPEALCSFFTWRSARCTSAIVRYGIWAVQIATKPKLSDADKDGEFVLKAPEGEEHRFSGIDSGGDVGIASLNALKI